MAPTVKHFSISGFIILLLVFMLINCSGDAESVSPEPEKPEPELPKVTVNIDKTVKYQTIEGFGFFGAADVWWGNASGMWYDAWGEKVITDLGITIWRNEVYPPSTADVKQDCDWAKQVPVVKGLKAIASKYNVTLKFIATVWSPPADLKWACNMAWAGDENATRNPGIVSTKNGGTLNPNKYSEYADWLKSHIALYKEEGVELFALSLQNELMFKQFFNSCQYTIPWYNELLINVVPKLKTNYPALKIFGSENMLEMEGKEENWKWFYHNGIKGNANADKNIDILAVHGYSDGVAATSGSSLAKMWANHYDQLSKPMGKQLWMTETSGYVESWEKSGDKPGALNLAMDMHSALYFGNINAWVWWQGSQNKIDEFSLMNGTVTGKKYQVSKHFYRYIRPGAVRVKSIADDEAFFVTAFENSVKGTHTIVIINSGVADKAISLTGEGLPASFKMYRSNSTSENCIFIKDVDTGAANRFTVPSKTIVTLQAGGDAL